MIALDVAGGPRPVAPEARAAGDYTDQQLASWLRAVTGSVRAGALAGLQVAAGAVARAFAAATVEGDDRLLDPLTLDDVGFDLVTRGEAVYLLGAGRGGLTLTRASTGTAVYGGPEPDTWRYTITAPGPSSIGDDLRTRGTRAARPAERGARGALARP